MAALPSDQLAGMTFVPSEMKRNYGLLRELDFRFHDLQKQMEKQCGDATQNVTAGRDDSYADAFLFEHSNIIATVQKECLRVAEGKLALAVQTYELVDSHIQQLDADFRKYEEERKQEREATGTMHLDYKPDGQLQEVSKGSKGGQKKGLKSFVDPKEPTYCYCNQVSYGEMIACDNLECKLEWFHFDCVGIKERPKGKWFCSDCSNCKRRRGV